MGVTGDKKHDSYATQYFMRKMQQWWTTFHEPVKSLHVHSDNAGSHFKSSKTMNFLSRLPALFMWLVTWSFGCPGHGKGPWDGFGGMLKRVMRRDTIDEKVVLKNSTDVAKYLRDRFECEDWKKKHDIDSNYEINQVAVFEAKLG